MISLARRHPVVTTLLLLAGLGLVWAGLSWATWPDVARLAEERPDTTAFMRRYLERRSAQPELPPLRHTWVPMSQISAHVKRAVVSGEDMEFFHHGGFSTSEIRAALREAVRDGELRGASTLTQQLAKNLWLTPSRNPVRKLREAALTRQLEKHLSKSRILEVYLNVVEFGPGIYGVGAASSVYFEATPSTLSERQAAMLAASLPRPSSWHPGVESRAYAGYVEDILGRMRRADFLWRYVDGPAPLDNLPPTTEPLSLDSLPPVTEPALDTIGGRRGGGPRPAGP
jgi:monofunctional biosynthetic peptidoglycan transglycosylase